MNIELICQCCKAPFQTQFKFRGKKYCSRTCYFKHVNEGKNKMGRKKDESLYEKRTCKVCNQEFESKKKQKKEICSNGCRLEWGKKNVVKEKRLEATKKTNLEKYGVDHVWKVKEIHQKTIDNTNKIQSVKKQQNTVREKTIKLLLNKLSEHNIKLISEYTTNKEHGTGSSIHYNFECLKCNNKFTSTLLGSGIIPRCNICYPSQKYSNIQNIVQTFLNDNKIKYTQNDRKTIKPYEIDFLLPDYNLGIEIHGLYYHGELNGKNRKYHLNKSIMAEKNNIKLLQIFEDEINDKKEIVLSKLSNELKLNNIIKINGRECEIKEITNKIKSEFLEKNHLQGDAKDTLRYGLYYNNDLISVITFGKRKINRGYSTNWELIRFCSKNYYSVRGGFSKLLSHTIKYNNIKEFITYADCRWSGTNPIKTVYSKNNFLFINKTIPNYWYFKSSASVKRYHRFNFRKSKLVLEGFDPNKTEWEIMQERGFDRIWDCGTLKFSYQR